LGSLFYGQDGNEGFREVWIQNGLISLPFILFFHWNTFKSNLDKILKALLTSTILCGAITFLFYLAPEPIARLLASYDLFFQEYPDVIDRTQFGLYSPFIDRLQFGYIVIFCLLYCIHKLLSQIRRGYFLALIFLFVVLLFLGARGAQIAFVIAVIPLLHAHLTKKFNSKNGKSSFFIFIVLVLGLAGGCTLIYKSVPAVYKRYNQMNWEWQEYKSGAYKNYDYSHFTTLTRIKSLEHTWAVIKKNPIWGVGVGNTRTALENQYQKIDSDVPIHHQNYFLYIWMAGGIGAFICIILFFISWLLSNIKNRGQPHRTMAISYFIFIILVLSMDAAMKYHIGVFGIPALMMSISAMRDT
jgi:hypothetical protein